VTKELAPERRPRAICAQILACLNDVHSDLLQHVDDPRRMETREGRNGAQDAVTRDRNRPDMFTGGGQIRP
jgi:hypothetical protein